MISSFYPKGIVSRWSEYRLLLTWRTYPLSIWFLISSHISHLINLNKSLRPGVVAQWHTPENPHAHKRLKQETQEWGLALATERVQIQSGIHESQPQNQTNRVSEKRTVLGFGWSSGSSLAKSVCDPSQGFNSVTDNRKWQCWCEIKCGATVESPLATPDTSEAWLYYCGVYTCNNQWTSFPGGRKRRPSSVQSLGAITARAFNDCCFQAVRLGWTSEYQTVLFLLCRPSAKAGTWKPQAHLLSLFNNY